MGGLPLDYAFDDDDISDLVSWHPEVVGDRVFAVAELRNGYTVKRLIEVPCLLPN